MFDPFYTTKPLGKGTGLGLSICYGGIVKDTRDGLHVSIGPEAAPRFVLSFPRYSQCFPRAMRRKHPHASPRFPIDLSSHDDLACRQTFSIPVHFFARPIWQS